MLREELVRGLPHEQLDLHPGLRLRGEGVEQGLVRHEVRAGDHHPAVGVVDQVVEQPQVVLGLEAGPGGDHLRVRGPGARLQGGGGLVQQQVVRLGVPVGDEHGVELRDHGAGAADHEVTPLPALPDVLPLVVRAVDDVL